MFTNKTANTKLEVQFGRGSVCLELHMFGPLEMEIYNLKDPQSLDKPISNSEKTGDKITFKFDTIADIDNVIETLKLLKTMNSKRA